MTKISIWQLVPNLQAQLTYFSLLKTHKSCESYVTYYWLSFLSCEMSLRNVIQRQIFIKRAVDMRLIFSLSLFLLQIETNNAGLSKLLSCLRNKFPRKMFWHRIHWHQQTSLSTSNKHFCCVFYSRNVFVLCFVFPSVRKVMETIPNKANIVSATNGEAVFC